MAIALRWRERVFACMGLCGVMLVEIMCLGPPRAEDMSATIVSQRRLGCQKPTQLVPAGGMPSRHVGGGCGSIPAVRVLSDVSAVNGS
jgi:hypothetical protein